MASVVVTWIVVDLFGGLGRQLPSDELSASTSSILIGSDRVDDGSECKVGGIKRKIGG